MKKASNDLRVRGTASAFATPQSFTAASIRKIYGFPEPSPNPVTVSVISFGGGLFGTVSPSGVLTAGDVHSYWTSIGMTATEHPKVIILTVDGATNEPVSGQTETYENTVDVEMIGGCCPTANLTILLIIAPNSLSEFPALIAKATAPITIDGITHTPSIVSISWGATEIDYQIEELNTVNTLFKTATEKGMNICVATGDLGSTNGIPGNINYVNFPASSPYVTACGGTTLVCPTLNYDDISTVETGWPKGGGGLSGTFPKPIWQTDVSGAIGINRCIPDIALNSDPTTGVDFIIDGSHYIYGGTSIAAPAMAAYYAVLNTNRFLLPSLYAAHMTNPLAFHDITVGTNGGYAAKVGYDLVTGFGSIAGQILKLLLLPVIPVTGVTVDNPTLTVIVGQQAQIVASIIPTNATNTSILWSSSDTTVATVAPATCSGAMACGCASSCFCGCAVGTVCQCTAGTTGVLTGITVGSVIATVTTVDGGFVATSAVTVTAKPSTIAVTGVTLNNAIVNMIVGSTKQLLATVSPPNATNASVTWSSSLTLIVTVSNTGLLTAIRAGKSTVTVTTVDGGFSARAVVNVTAPLYTIGFSPSSILLYTYVRYQSNLVFSLRNVSTQVIYSSTNPLTAAVDSSGLVTTYNPGSTIIRAITSEGMIAFLNIFVFESYQYYASRSTVIPNKVRKYTDTSSKNSMTLFRR